MARIIMIGEIMLRLTPLHKRRIIQAHSFDAFFGGAEANVAISETETSDDQFRFQLSQ